MGSRHAGARAAQTAATLLCPLPSLRSSVVSPPLPNARPNGPFGIEPVEFGRSASLHVRRAKNSKPSVHPLRGDEIRALHELRRQFPDSGFAFPTERGGPFTADAINRLIKRIGERAGMPFPGCATAAATRWPMPGMIRGLFRTSSVSRQRVSRISGAIENANCRPGRFDVTELTAPYLAR